MTKNFNENLDVKLIKLVKENTVLYDTRHPHYMDFNTREVVWQKIGDELKRPAADCKSRWINIRDINRRILRKSLTKPSDRVKPYKYDKELSFMRPFYRDILSNNDIDSNDFNNDEDDFEQDDDNEYDNNEHAHKKIKIESSSKPPKKKKRRKIFCEVSAPTSLNTINTQHIDSAGPSDFDPADPVDAFLISIAATLKTFSPYHLNLTKSKIFDVVQEHDLQQIMERQNNQMKLPNEDPLYKNI